MVALVITHSFDYEMSVRLFDTFELAQKEMEKQVEEKLQIAEKANLVRGEDYEIEEDEDYAFIRYYTSHEPYESTIKWRVGEVQAV